MSGVQPKLGTPRGQQGGTNPDLLPATRAALEEIGRPWVIENVPGAPMPGAAELCGTNVRPAGSAAPLFLGSFLILAPAEPCCHRGAI